MSEEVKKENTNAKDLTAEIKDLVVEFRTDYGVVQALNSMELEIERGKTLGLVGETGNPLPPASDSGSAGSNRQRFYQA